MQFSLTITLTKLLIILMENIGTGFIVAVADQGLAVNRSAKNARATLPVT